ncbi:MAG TPA: hypothetical protein VMF86_12870 [Stellaceae bacterium]|nr:hypothetical protein [Stellaceae bacterium]
MAIVFSPVDGKELDSHYAPRPRHAFLMLHSGDAVSAIEQEMATAVRASLTDLRFIPIAATDIPATGDFLSKIVDLIRGCGFGVAIYSDQTPSRTLGNIFFEIGISHLLGKPVQLLVAGRNPTPSDFVRTEWLPYDQADRNASIAKLRDSLKAIEQQAEQFFKLGEVMMEADVIDYELAFERFKQAVLISGHEEARQRIALLAGQLGSSSATQSSMANHRQRLRGTIGHFLRLLP